MRIRIFIFAILLALPNAAMAVVLHSAFPLIAPKSMTYWPQSCSHDNTLAMCGHFALGVWSQRDGYCASQAQPNDCTQWIGLGIFSMFDGGYTFSQSQSKEAAGVPQEFASLVELSDPSAPVGLYALQIGYNPGSRYLLISAQRTEVITHAVLLNTRCLSGVPGVIPRADPHPPGLFATDYCDVSSYAALKRIAEDALNRAPLAMLDWNQPAPAR